ncbi:hypothetical protein F4553_004134 [Allocatelliglobosispora scoriae]|uniref:Septum formation-related domain-containing protein n=1 Tax=Allocatelliglobosispora scoriae TaxID=643052 RepID=A0A841BSS2_9ACTN|nr:septum formation family protein [Allocatelliglobosispora scoriae]MBB5870755.1 hypothetical protein [Allocatelliglobosispora scoriae]
MRRWIAAVAMAGAAAILMSGCTSLPQGVDAAIADEWTDIKPPTGWSPEPGNCQAAAFTETIYRSNYLPIACTDEHKTEVVHVGTFPESVRNVPSRGGPELLAALAECDAKSTAFLGGHWQDGKLWIGVSMPSSEAWISGTRWFRCEVVQLDDLYGDAVSRKSSLKDALKTDASVKIGCQNYKSGAGFTPIACTSKHNAEYAGSYFGAKSYAALKNKQAMWDACYKIIAKWANVSASTVKYRTGIVTSYPSQAEWNEGDHAVRCWLWLDRKTVTKSMKGAGSKGLPM